MSVCAYRVVRALPSSLSWKANYCPSHPSIPPSFFFPSFFFPSFSLFIFPVLQKRPRSYSGRRASPFPPSLSHSPPVADALATTDEENGEFQVGGEGVAEEEGPVGEAAATPLEEGGPLPTAPGKEGVCSSADRVQGAGVGGEDGCCQRRRMRKGGM